MSGLSGSSALADALNLVSVALNIGAVLQDRMLHRESVEWAREHHIEQVGSIEWMNGCA